MRNAVKRSEKDANKYLVEDMPMVFLNAIKKGEDVLLDPETFYHMKVAGPSYYDQTFGIPPMLAIMKDAWLYQTYRRAQEAIAVEHILPLRILIPRPVSGDHSPHIHNDLGQWSHRMQGMISKWRRDPNAIFTAPFPCEVQNIGGQAQALQVHNDMTQLRQSIAVGLDIPADLIYGSMSWSGSSVTLRMLENQFLTRISQLDRFLYSFLVPKLRAWLDLPDISIKHRDFKMADDAQQKQIALSFARRTPSPTRRSSRSLASTTQKSRSVSARKRTTATLSFSVRWSARQKPRARPRASLPSGRPSLPRSVRTQPSRPRSALSLRATAML